MNEQSEDIEEVEGQEEENEHVILRSYSKAILFYPLMVYSFIAWIWEIIYEAGGATKPLLWLGVVWVAIFFANLFAIAFDFSAKKFLILFLSIVILILVLFILYAEGILTLSFLQLGIPIQQLDLNLSADFYLIFAIGLGIFLGLVIIGARLNYVKVEQNEVYIRNLFSRVSNRHPTSDLKIQVQITDIFEYISLGAGSIHLIFNTEKAMELKTVPFINKKQSKLDEILSTRSVDLD